MKIPYGFIELQRQEVTVNSNPGLLIHGITKSSPIDQETEALEITAIQDNIQGKYREIQRSLYFENPYLIHPENIIIPKPVQQELFVSELSQVFTPHTLTPDKYQELFGVFLGSSVSNYEKGMKEERIQESFFYYPYVNKIRLRTKTSSKNYYPGKHDSFELVNKFFELGSISLPSKIKEHLRTITN